MSEVETPQMEATPTPKPKAKAKRTPKLLTPTQLAASLAGAGNAEKVAKTFVRPYLRRHFARKSDARGTSWYLTAAQTKAIRTAWKKRQA